MSDSEQVKLMVHHVRFFNFQPQTINCIAYDETSQRVAVSRADGSVEILAKKDNWMLEMTITGDVEDSVEALLWCRGRLFAGNMRGNVFELDLHTGRPKGMPVSSNAGPIWCLCKNSTGDQIAAGTEDGCVVLFDVSEDLQFLRGFAKQEGRILSVAWFDQDGENIIISGGINSLRQWSVKSGQPISRMTIGRRFNQDTIVWCVAVTKEFTVISGDSRGVVTFWNGKEATQSKTFHCHKADVLSLCLSEDETQVFSGGVDAALYQFTLCAADQVTERKRWIHQPLHWRHTHDVRAVAYCDGYLASGGVDTNLYVSKLRGTKMVFSVAPVLKPGEVSLAKERNLLLLQYSTHLEVWRLGAANTPFAEERGILPLTKKRMKLAKIPAHEGSQIVCSAISDKGDMLGYSDSQCVRLFSFILENENSIHPMVSVKRLNVVTLPKLSAASMITFTPDGGHFLSVLTSGNIYRLDLANGKFNQMERQANASPIHNLCVSPNSHKFAITTLDHEVKVYNVRSLEHICSCPVLQSQVSSVAFSPHSPTLAIAYSDHSIYEFDLEKKELTSWSRRTSAHMKRNWLKPLRHIARVSFLPDSPDKIFVHTDSAFSVLDKTKELKVYEKQRHTSHEQMEEIARTCYKYKYLLFAEFASNGMLVVVERPPSQIEDNLPPSFKQKKFGVA